MSHISTESDLKYAENDLKLGKNDLKYYDLKMGFPSGRPDKWQVITEGGKGNSWEAPGLWLCALKKLKLQLQLHAF